MTIATRNRFIRLAALVALALAIIAFASIITILIRHSLPAIAPGKRPFPLLDRFFLTKWDPVATIAAIGVFPVLSLMGLFYILFAFEKTQAIEVTFFAACIFILSLEAIRIFIPLYQLWTHANFFSATISRTILFCRIFILLALLASGIFTTSGAIQQIGPSIFLLAFFSLSLSNVIPINTGTISSTFLIPSGFRGMIDILFTMIGFLGVISYLVLGKTRGIPEYSAAAAGLVLLLAGYAFLALCDSWLFFVAGSLLISFGAWRYLTKLHGYYLWQ